MKSEQERIDRVEAALPGTRRDNPERRAVGIIAGASTILQRLGCRGLA